MLRIEESLDEYGEIPEDLQEYLIIKDDELQVKSCNIVNYIKVLEAEVEMADKEKKRIDGVKKKIESVSSRLKGMLLQAVLSFGHQDKPTATQKKAGKEGTKRLQVEKDTQLYKLSDKQLDSLVLEEDLLPSKYRNIELAKMSEKNYKRLITILQESKDLEEEEKDKFLSILVPKTNGVTPNKALIKQDIKAEVVIEGARLVNTRTLTIK
jgi:hypothetical protein